MRQKVYSNWAELVLDLGLGLANWSLACNQSLANENICKMFAPNPLSFQSPASAAGCVFCGSIKSINLNNYK